MHHLRLLTDGRAGLPADRTRDSTPRTIEDAVLCVTAPTPLAHPAVVLTDPGVLRAVGCADLEPAVLAELTAGNALPTGAVPAAFGYCGHQFGSFAGQLGDGAALSLGEVEVPPHGVGGPTRVELQLKGTGPTPYTRSGLSGRKPLAALVHEFVQMAALRRLGIPTVSAAALALGDDGHAVLLRCGRSFLRFGTMELANQAGPNGVRGPAVGNTELIRAVADNVLGRFYPAVREAGAEDAEGMYRELLLAITKATARLTAGWQCAGWVHGALNTDNMSLVGETLDHGTGGFVEEYRHDWCRNTVDVHRRYSYRRQPAACRENCRRLAEAMQPLHCERLDGPDGVAARVDAAFDAAFASAYLDGMRAKLALNGEAGGDHQLVQDLLDAMDEGGCDFATTFATLAAPDVCWEVLPAPLQRWRYAHADRLAGRCRGHPVPATPWIPRSAWLGRLRDAITSGRPTAETVIRGMADLQQRLDQEP